MAIQTSFNELTRLCDELRRQLQFFVRISELNIEATIQMCQNQSHFHHCQAINEKVSLSENALHKYVNMLTFCLHTYEDRLKTLCCIWSVHRLQVQAISPVGTCRDPQKCQDGSGWTKQEPQQQSNANQVLNLATFVQSIRRDHLLLQEYICQR
jgi:hypothetical protein